MLPSRSPVRCEGSRRSTKRLCQKPVGKPRGRVRVGERHPRSFRGNPEKYLLAVEPGKCPVLGNPARPEAALRVVVNNRLYYFCFHILLKLCNAGIIKVVFIFWPIDF